MDNGQALTIAFLIGIGILAYKTYDFWKQRNDLQKKLNEIGDVIGTAKKDMKSIADDADDTIEALFLRHADTYTTVLAIFKEISPKLPATVRQKIAHKIARDAVVSASKHPAPLYKDNDQMLAYFETILPDIGDKIDGYDAKIDTKEITEAIEDEIMKTICKK